MNNQKVMVKSPTSMCTLIGVFYPLNNAGNCQNLTLSIIERRYPSHCYSDTGLKYEPKQIKPLTSCKRTNNGNCQNLTLLTIKRRYLSHCYSDAGLTNEPKQNNQLLVVRETMMEIVRI